MVKIKLTSSHQSTNIIKQKVGKNETVVYEDKLVNNLERSLLVLMTRFTAGGYGLHITLELRGKSSAS